MAKRRKVSKEKKETIAKLIEMYDIQSAEDIQEAMKDLLGDTIQSMLESEFDEHLGYDPYERSDTENARNGYKNKTIRSSYGESEISVPQDRESSFEPQIVKKRQKDISEIEQKIISMYARGLSTRQISDQVEEIYGFEVSEGLVSNITNKLLPQIEDWQHRVLHELYPIIFIDAIHFSVKDNGIIVKKAAYIVLGINQDGLKEVLGIYIGKNESSKYWLGILNELKNRGVKDILVLCADGLTGMKEAVATAYPKTEYQRCIVHQVRNTLKYVSYKHRKEFATDLKTIYHAPNEKVAYDNLSKVTTKWDEIYPHAMKSWSDNWDVISPIFKFAESTRKVIYTRVCPSLARVPMQ